MKINDTYRFFVHVALRADSVRGKKVAYLMQNSLKAGD